MARAAQPRPRAPGVASGDPPSLGSPRRCDAVADFRRMRVENQSGGELERVTVLLTVGEAKWLLDRLEDQLLADYPDASDATYDEVVKLAFDTNTDD